MIGHIFLVDAIPFSVGQHGCQIEIEEDVLIKDSMNFLLLRFLISFSLVTAADLSKCSSE
jgi:hypothetical protein